MANNPDLIYGEREQSIDLFCSSPQDTPDIQYQDPYPPEDEEPELFDDGFAMPLTAARPTRVGPQKFKKSKIVALAATMVAATVGGLSVINPLLSRPKLTKESYSLVEKDKIHYAFTLSSPRNYDCSLSLLCDEKEVAHVPLSAGNYDDSFFVETPGTYSLYFDATNRVDYHVHALKFTITIQEVVS